MKAPLAILAYIALQALAGPAVIRLVTIPAIERLAAALHPR